MKGVKLIFGALLLASAALLFRSEIELWLAMKVRGEEPQQPSIVMLGDSLTEVANWKILARCRSISNLGIGGNSTAQMLDRLSDALSKNPKLVFVMAGTNDARRYVPNAETLANLRTIEAKVTERGIAYASLTPPPLPSRGSAVDAAISGASLPIPFTLDDLQDDQIHLRRSGYAKWRDAIAPLVQKFC